MFVFLGTIWKGASTSFSLFFCWTKTSVLYNNMSIQLVSIYCIQSFIHWKKRSKIHMKEWKKKESKSIVMKLLLLLKFHYYCTRHRLQHYHNCLHYTLHTPAFVLLIQAYTYNVHKKKKKKTCVMSCQSRLIILKNLHVLGSTFFFLLSLFFLMQLNSAIYKLRNLIIAKNGGRNTNSQS
jgi:hypothetical protein